MTGKILIVDDERTLRTAVRDMLARDNCLAVTASSPEEAVCRCKTERFDLLITDLKMPGGTGLELVREVRTVCPDIRVILMTAYGSLESAIEALRLGVSDYILKPFRLSELRMTARRLLAEVEQAHPAPQPSAFGRTFEFRLDNATTLSGTLAADDDRKAEAARDAVRVAARALSLYLVKHSALIDPAIAAEAVSDVLYLERLCPVDLVCTAARGDRRTVAAIGSAATGLADSGSSAPAPGSRLAAGSFPGLRATVSGQAAHAADDAFSSTGVITESRVVFAGVPAQATHTLSLESDKVDLKLIVEKIGCLARSAGFSVERTNHFISAVNEAVLNSIEHAYREQPGKVDVSCSVFDREMVATVRDYGRGFDPAVTPGGGGFDSFKRLMDRVAIESAPGAGTTVYLAKAL